MITQVVLTFVFATVLVGVKSQQFQFSRMWHPGKRASDLANPLSSWGPFSGLGVTGSYRYASRRQPDTTDGRKVLDDVDFDEFHDPNASTTEINAQSSIYQPQLSSVPIKVSPSQMILEPVSLLVSFMCSGFSSLANGEAGPSKHGNLLPVVVDEWKNWCFDDYLSR